jgi:ProP effector
MADTVAPAPSVTDLLCVLVERFPQAFSNMSDQIRPLKVGIYDDLVAATDLDPAALKRALKFYTGLTSYQHALAAEGAMRVDLAGNTVEPVSPDHAQWAREKLATGRKKAIAKSAPSTNGTAPAGQAVWCASPATLLQGVQPVTVAAKLTFTLREIPHYTEKNGYAYVALTNQQRGLPAGVHLADVPLYLGVTVKAWNKARQSALTFQQHGKPFVLVIECHVSVKDGALIALGKGIQVVEGKPVATKEKTA